MFNNDSRVVLTLDAGGTNFVFSAIQGNREIVEPVTFPANPESIEDCLRTLVKGFNLVKKALPISPVAISFAFPGPADYRNGVIGNLPNFPAFRGGVALGPFLQNTFGIPVFINNDGNLFAYGEALAGILPEINQKLKASGSQKQYKNLLAITFGTGFGGGVVIENQLLLGDNGCGGDVWLSAYKNKNELIAEEGVSKRAVNRFYNELSGENPTLTPKEIFDIAEGTAIGNQMASRAAFSKLGEIAGFTIAESLNIVDGLVVIGGGLAAAHKYFMPALVAEMNGQRGTLTGASFPRMEMKAYNLLNENELNDFLKDEINWVKVTDSNESVKYDSVKKTGITTSSLGASKAISLGAYAYALTKLNEKAV